MLFNFFKWFQPKPTAMQLDPMGVLYPVGTPVYLNQTTPQRFKPFYIHKDLTGYPHVKKFKGFTAYIFPSDMPRRVNVSLAFCSKKDAFCKAVGRKASFAAMETSVNIRHLPSFLAEQEALCMGRVMMSDTRYNYVLKYVV